ncbi:MAG TPA: hypothetical protein VKA04_11725 [Pseudodesulfovibrio sp.]|nr:hypothetical protein [Pseudodesulfovibrio sp.]
MTHEQERIDFLVRRDGPAEARAWVERTLHMYRDAVNTPLSHASLPEYRPRFEQAIDEFQIWLAAQDQSPCA